jgi:hypothetical protein
VKARERRVLALGGGIVVVAALVLRVIPWGVRSVAGQHERLTVQSELLARAQDDIRGAATLVDSGAVLEGRVRGLAPKILSGASEAEAVADLAAKLGASATRHRVKVKRTDLLRDPTRAGQLRAVRLRASLEGDSRGTVELLRSLTRDDVVLTLPELRVAAIDPHSTEQRPEILRTEVTVRGWFLERRPGK